MKRERKSGGGGDTRVQKHLRFCIAEWEGLHLHGWFGIDGEDGTLHSA